MKSVIKLNFPKGSTTARVHMGKKNALVERGTEGKILDGISASEITSVEFGAMLKEKGKKDRKFHPLAIQPEEFFKKEAKAEAQAPTKEPSKETAKEPATQTAAGYAAELLKTGKYTANEVAQKLVEKFGGDLQPRLINVRSVIYRLNKEAKAHGSTFTAKPAAPGESKLGFIRGQFVDGKHTSAEVADMVTKKFGGDEAKNRSMVYSAPYHFRKAGIKGGWKQAEKAVRKAKKTAHKK